MEKIAYRSLLITNEHAITGKMGGIGSCNSEIDSLVENILILLIDDEVGVSPADNVIICSLFVDKYLPGLSDAYGDYEQKHYVIYRVVQKIIELNPQIANIESHEYGADVRCVIGAARLGLLGKVKTRILCHGGRVQLERATGLWDGHDSSLIHQRERYIIQKADEVWFPSEYLKNLYNNLGIRPKDSLVTGLPYKFNDNFQNIKFTKIENLIFIGRMNKLKGCDIFLRLAEYIISSGFNIKAVHMIGKNEGELSREVFNFNYFAKKNNVDVKECLMSRENLMLFIKKNHYNSLFILPYYSDNFSVAMLEIIEAAGALTVLDTGGNSELVNCKKWLDCVAKDEDDLLRIVKEKIKVKPSIREADSLNIRNSFIKIQKNRNLNIISRINNGISNGVSLKPAKYADYELLKPDDGISSIDKKLIKKIAESSFSNNNIDAISFSYSYKGNFVCPDSSDVADIMIRNLRHSFILIKKNILDDFNELINSRDVVFSEYGDMIAGLMMYLDSVGVDVDCCPEIIGEIDKVPKKTFNKSIEYLYLACRKNIDWNVNRYIASLFHYAKKDVYYCTFTKSDRISDLFRLGQYKKGLAGCLIRFISSVLFFGLDILSKAKRLFKKLFFK